MKKAIMKSKNRGLFLNLLIESRLKISIKKANYVNGLELKSHPINKNWLDELQ